MRFAIMFLAVVGLALAGLNSAIARFAVILPERAKFDISHPANPCVLLAALASTLFVITGAVLASLPKRLRDQGKPWVHSRCVLCILGLVIVSTGAHLADTYTASEPPVRCSDDSFQYYNIMYNGGVFKVAYELLVISMDITAYVAISVSDR
ncbi:hypothetical protein N7452_004197 [Penicillium brevicompactum]|uniref:Uncharacterized protein n=1 Tax=Penicillium brevicompactum TaxID=5074 RepID=A0A9W9ULG7_PENBR|nr:hypothetical protein N7452_004197 [Penicillium brevicompactum]